MVQGTHKWCAPTSFYLTYSFGINWYAVYTCPCENCGGVGGPPRGNVTTELNDCARDLDWRDFQSGVEMDVRRYAPTIVTPITCNQLEEVRPVLDVHYRRENSYPPNLGDPKRDDSDNNTIHDSGFTHITFNRLVELLTHWTDWRAAHKIRPRKQQHSI